MLPEITKTVSVIIVNYNAGHRIIDCVQSIVSEVYEVIVVDNASSDNSLALFEAFFSDKSNIKVVRNLDNQGFAKGCNSGVKAATGDYLLFLNPDCRVQQGALVKLLQVSESDEHIGMAGGLLLNPDGSEQAGGRRSVPTPWRTFVRAFRLTALSRYWPKLFQDFNLHNETIPEHPIAVEAISGACMMVKRQALEDVGLLDEEYFMHCEDLDWCHRFRIKQWKVMFVPEAQIIHFQGTCSKKTPLFVEWHKHKGMIKYYRKFFSQQYPGALMLLVMLGVYLRFSMIVACHYIQQLHKKLLTDE